MIINVEFYNSKFQTGAAPNLAIDCVTVIDTPECKRHGPSKSAMQNATLSAENMRSSRTWKIVAHFSPSQHLMLTSVGSLYYSQQRHNSFIEFNNRKNTFVMS